MNTMNTDRITHAAAGLVDRTLENKVSPVYYSPVSEAEQG